MKKTTGRGERKKGAGRTAAALPDPIPPLCTRLGSDPHIESTVRIPPPSIRPVKEKPQPQIPPAFVLGAVGTTNEATKQRDEFHSPAVVQWRWDHTFHAMGSALSRSGAPPRPPSSNFSKLLLFFASLISPNNSPFMLHASAMSCKYISIFA